MRATARVARAIALALTFIDQVALYARALSALEVADSYNAGAGRVTCPP